MKPLVANGPEKLFLVLGFIGEEDHDITTWPVRAFRDEPMARAFADMAQEHANHLYKTHGAFIAGKHPPSHDPHMKTAASGTGYYIEEIEVV